MKHVRGTAPGRSIESDRRSTAIEPRTATMRWPPPMSYDQNKTLQRDDDEREERHTFDQRRRDDHGRLDVAGDLGLASHALDGALGQAADAERRPDDHQPGADRLQVGERSGPAGLAAASLCASPSRPPGETGRRPKRELDQLHLTLDSLHFWRHASLNRCAGHADSTRRPRRNHGGFDQEIHDRNQFRPLRRLTGLREPLRRDGKLSPISLLSEDERRTR